MKKTNLFFVLITILVLSLSSCADNPERIIPNEPSDPEQIDDTVWANTPDGIHSGFASIDIAYSKSHPPSQNPSDSIFLYAWKGEKISSQLLIWSNSDAGDIIIETDGLYSDDDHIGSGNIEIRTVKYVLSDEFLKGCGFRDKDSIPAHIYPDMLDNSNRFYLQAMETRPVWISISIPENTKPGLYTGKINRISQTNTISNNISIEVQNKQLPPPAKWKFHLDLWQNPYAVARYHNVEPWSHKHIEKLKPLLRILADAGQKCITTTLNHKPWEGQTNDPFDAMITWIRNSDGYWEYDYSIFDRYVRLAMECGITEQINCYSMVPWGNKIRWFDQDSANFITTELIPGTKEYEDFWKPFLNNFKVHLMEQGWLDITTLALDERKLDEMKKLFSFMKTSAPEFKIAMAGHYFDEINPQIYDYSYNWRHISDASRGLAQKRNEAGQKTTYYVACGIPKPNNFTFSPPSESCYEGWFAAAMGFDGFLRWAYNSWPENPVIDSRFSKWPAGDTYFVYPDARSSVRFERLIEGIQDYEKLLILKRDLALDPSIKAAAAELRIQEFLGNINSNTLDEYSASEVINHGKKMIYEITEDIFAK